jgi:hypothetical protein
VLLVAYKPVGELLCGGRQMIDSILWRRLDAPGHEIAALEAAKEGWRLSGTAVFSHERRPCRLEYFVTVDSTWRTTEARVNGVIDDEGVDVHVLVDAERRWRANGAECLIVDGCLDIDLGFSPSTNLLPIRRLGLAVGEEAAVIAAWLPFPSLVFERLPQVYRREAERTYRYESSGGAFVRRLEVDHTGFVTSYPGLWQVEAG